MDNLVYKLIIMVINYSQKNGPIGRNLHGLLGKNAKITKELLTKLDGAWKRVYEIAYVNDIPVDTTLQNSK